ncbi:MAG: hypothetical protein ABIR87_05150 [Sphingomicrobium sp.]
MAEWFTPKRYGLGGTPITWQGWAVTLAFSALALGVTAAFHDKPLLVAAILVPATLVVLLITIRTTRGGWAWRWGNDK